MSKNYERLFETARIGNMVLKNRLVFPPVHTRFFEGTEHTYNHWHTQYFQERAKGGVGLIITGITKAEKEIDPYPIDMYPTIDSDQRIRELAEIAETVHRYGAKITSQLIPGVGVAADIPQPDRWPAAPSRQPLIWHTNLMARELTKAEIVRLVQAYGEAAGRLKRAGFDALFVSTLSYLFEHFISECWNQRTDEYGGSLKNRMRFLAECMECARGFVGKDFPVIVSLAMEHGFKEGRKLEESIVIAKEIEKLGVDAFYVRDGVYPKYGMEAFYVPGGVSPGERTVPNAFFKDGMIMANAEKFKREVETPIIVAQQIGDPDQCEKAIIENRVEFIALGRALLSDPEWPNKVRQGKVEEIRPCIKCMECLDRYFHGKYIECAVNARLGHERELPIMPACPPKKVLVVGGGPAGMEAARIASSRGHKVTLIEKKKRLGGLLDTAAVPDYKYRIGRYAVWLERQLKKTGVKVQTGVEGAVDLIKEKKPDVIIVATGAKPFAPEVPGTEKGHVFHALDVLNGKAEVGEKIVIVGGRSVGCETAYFLAKQGKKVDLVVRSEILPDESILSKFSLLNELHRYGVTIHLQWQPREIRNNGVMIKNGEGEEKFLEADTVIMGTGLVSDHSVAKSLEGLAEEVYEIGDSVAPRKIYDAVHEGYLVGKEI